MKTVLGMIFSARAGGNLSDLASGLFARISERVPDLLPEIVETAPYRIQSCNGCNYECLLGQEGQGDCPIQDDVPALWRRALASDLLIYFLPTYGGMPPATWIAFLQRFHAMLRHRASLPTAKDGQIAVLTLHEPLSTRAGDMSQSLIVQYLAAQPRRLVTYEPIIPSSYGLNSLYDRLVTHSGIQHRLDEMSRRLTRAMGA